MNISKKLAHFFDSAVRNCGRDYSRSGKVYFGVYSESLLTAQVAGSHAYSIKISHSRGNRLDLSCSCPYIAKWDRPCEHLWAAILAAEHRGWAPFLFGPAKNITLSASFGDDNLALPFSPETDPGNGDIDIFAPEFAKRKDDKSEVMKKLMEMLPPFPMLGRTPALAPAPPVPKREWREVLSGISSSIAMFQRKSEKRARKPVYVVDLSRHSVNNGLTIEILISEQAKNGMWKTPCRKQINDELICGMEDENDRLLLSSLLGAARDVDRFFYPFANGHGASVFILPAASSSALIEQMCSTGKALVRLSDSTFQETPLQWDSAGAWDFRLHIENKPGAYFLDGLFTRGASVMPMQKPHAMFACGLIFWDDRVAPLEHFGSFQWIHFLREENRVEIPIKDELDLLDALYGMPSLPLLELPKELQITATTIEPTKEIKILSGKDGSSSRSRLTGVVQVLYDGKPVTVSCSPGKIFNRHSRTLIERNREKEKSAIDEVFDAGFTRTGNNSGRDAGFEFFKIVPGRFPAAVRSLVEKGWHVEADGKVFRRANSFSLKLTSGIDWFGLSGDMHFGACTVHLPRLLEAARKDGNWVRLDDGTFGILPETWIAKYARLSAFGEVGEENVKFNKNQASLLDALLSARPEISADEAFSQVRRRLESYNGVKPREASGVFNGTLRDYQKEGLGWLFVLKYLGMGGCLADDMGLGKTVQVLAFLEAKRAARAPEETKNPDIIVVPRSLLFNWEDEAGHFTPKLKVLGYSGTDRSALRNKIHHADAVLVTYGTLRRDIADLSGIAFGHAILDEAQAIKNPKSQAAKAARLLNAEHRLALSGTPVENSLDDLWSIFEFLNPGMLSNTSVFNRIQDDDSRKILGRALRPYILRRTKAQVAGELPERTEQVIYCEMEKEQKSMYDELKKFYKASLLRKLKDKELGRFKIEILEALLRLRQAACHPGLINEKLRNTSSAKLGALLEQLREITSEGHKALVFSQFTTFLGIFRSMLEHENIPFLYLDGQTVDRQTPVYEFQNNPEYQIFLISLKAGGLGLNLTAAEYVFILDPWWNPAVEAQAIDRAHRIGQTRSVFAYKMICRDTVEERVLDLQKKKRDLANLIISGDNSLLKDMTRADLARLLS